MKRLKLTGFLGIGLSCVVFAFVASAQQTGSEPGYPTKPITLIVAQSAGGSTDMGARVLAAIAEKDLGQPIIVVNRVGGGGQIGWTELARQKPDGYSLAVVNLPALNTVTLNPDRKAAFGLDAFEPIANQILDQGIITVRTDSPYKSLQDLITDAKKNPGKIRVGIVGLHGHAHFGLLSLQEAAGVKLRTVQMEGSPAIAMALMGGHVDVGIDRVGSWATRVRAGDLRGLAVLDRERSKFVPGVPTSAEQGFPDVVTASAAGIVGPKGIPDPILRKLEAVFRKAIESPEHVEKIEKTGQRIKPMGRSEYADYMRDWQNRTRRLLELAAKAE